MFAVPKPKVFARLSTPDPGLSVIHVGQSGTWRGMLPSTSISNVRIITPLLHNLIYSPSTDCICLFVFLALQPTVVVFSQPSRGF
jgi:hypothetical protein